MKNFDKIAYEIVNELIKEIETEAEKTKKRAIKLQSTVNQQKNSHKNIRCFWCTKKSVIDCDLGGKYVKMCRTCMYKHHLNLLLKDKMMG